MKILLVFLLIMTLLFCETQGKIRSAIGLARLGMESKGRFNQFEKLIDDCEFKRGVKVTTCQDLQVPILNIAP